MQNVRRVSGKWCGTSAMKISDLLTRLEVGRDWRAAVLCVFDSGNGFEAVATRLVKSGARSSDLEVTAHGLVLRSELAEGLAWIPDFSQVYFLDHDGSGWSHATSPWTTDAADFEVPDRDAEISAELDRLGAHTLLADGDWLNAATSRVSIARAIWGESID